MRDVEGYFNYSFYYLFLLLRINELLSQGRDLCVKREQYA